MNTAIVVQCIAVAGSIFTGVWAVKCKSHIQQVHLLINSRLSALLLAVTEVAYLKGATSAAAAAAAVNQEIVIDAEELKRTAKIAAEVLIETARVTADKLVWKK